MTDEIDPTEVHIALLRELEGGEPLRCGLTLDRSTAARDLACWLLTHWSGGFSSSSGEYVQVRKPGVYITPAGRAALAAYDLGKRRGAS